VGPVVQHFWVGGSVRVRGIALFGLELLGAAGQLASRGQGGGLPPRTSSRHVDTLRRFSQVLERSGWDAASTGCSRWWVAAKTQGLPPDVDEFLRPRVCAANRGDCSGSNGFKIGSSEGEAGKERKKRRIDEKGCQA
jgi:hypothetical protein